MFLSLQIISYTCGQCDRDNNVYFEFHHSTSFVNDHHVGQTLLQRQMCGGLYELNISSQT